MTILRLVLAKFLHRLFENIQRLFCLQICLAANHQHPENIQRLFRLQVVSQPQLAIIH